MSYFQVFKIKVEISFSTKILLAANLPQISDPSFSSNRGRFLSNFYS